MQLQIEYQGFNNTHESIRWSAAAESFMKKYEVPYYCKSMNILGTESKHIYYPNSHNVVDIDGSTLQDLMAVAVEYHATIMVKPNGVISIVFK